MKVTIKNKVMTIEIPLLDTAKPSSTGKSLIHATTSGNVPVELLVNGQPLIVSVNAYTKIPS
jgi:hypothetical protein